MNQKWVAFLRIVIGVFFLSQGLNKLDWYTTSEFLRTSLDRYSLNASPATIWYQKHIAYPGIEAWSRLIPTGEMLIGIALVLGLLTRAALIGAIALVLNYHLTNGSLFTPAFLSNPYTLVGTFLPSFSSGVKSREILLPSTEQLGKKRLKVNLRRSPVRRKYRRQENSFFAAHFYIPLITPLLIFPVPKIIS